MKKLIILLCLCSIAWSTEYRPNHHYNIIYPDNAPFKILPVQLYTGVDMRVINLIYSDANDILPDTNYFIVNRPYSATFVGTDDNYPGKELTKTVTITIDWKMTTNRFCKAWLTNHQVADLNKDGNVNFIDFALFLKNPVGLTSSSSSDKPARA